MSTPVLRFYRKRGWTFAYDPASDRIRPTRPPGTTDAEALEARRLVGAHRAAVVRALREEAALDRLDTSPLTSAEKAEVDWLAELGQMDRLEALVGELNKRHREGAA